MFQIPREIGRIGGALVAALSMLLLQGPAQAARSEHVSAELVAQHSAVQPGQSIQVGLLLVHDPHWHSYWRNPGDSGLPTTIEWTLPANSRIGAIEWPAPKRLPIGPLVNYGYEDELLLPLRFTAPADARPGDELLLKARANWLECKDVCIPASALLELRLPVVAAGVQPGGTRHAALFEQAAAEQPTPLQGWTAEMQQSGRELLLTLEAADATALPAALPEVQVFPYPEQLIDPARHELYRTPRGYAVRMQLTGQAEPPQRLHGIVVAQRDAGAAIPWGGTRRSAEFEAGWRAVDAIALPAGARGAGRPDAAAVALHGGPPLGASAWAALLLAFAGGILLNLMPCVFPVLSIKLLSLSQQGTDRTALRWHAAAYTGGVLLTFLALAGGLIALQEAGSAVGWGFQLQEPGVVFVLALLFFAIGLNLAGVFEFGQLMPQRLAGWRARRPAGDAFASGVLAVVAASPCTAPFMGAALGYALTQSAPTALAVFAALGLGMAIPYALLTLFPGWRGRLPKAGSWMVHLKQALAFPMFATAVWLLWVLGQQAGVDAMAQLLLVLVGLSAFAWLAGIGGSRAWIGRALGGAAVLALLSWAWPSALAPAPPVQRAAAGAADRAEASAWRDYDAAELDRLTAAGRPVFVDFTAAWCVSCQVNKRLVLDTDAASADFARFDVVLMRADWTRRDDAITQALARLGRNGVPVYALYRPGRETLLLPEILTQRILREALATLSP